MRIHLHLGLHKTGTTSLQQVLLDALGAPDPQPIWYPAPVANGPGHAELAWRAVGYNNRVEDGRVLAELAQAAAQGGCRDLVLSSEEFRRAIPGKLDRLAELGMIGSLLPIVTLAPIGRRTVSLWQEMIKHGHRQPLADSYDAIAERLIEAPFLAALAESFSVLPGRPRIAIIMAGDVAEPALLFRRFVAATGLPLPDAAIAGKVPVLNRSRAQVSLPPAWHEVLKRRACAAIDAIRALEGSDRVTIHGDLEFLDDLPVAAAN